jgi:hypothetical protein
MPVSRRPTSRNGAEMMRRIIGISQAEEPGGEHHLMHASGRSR